MIVVRVPASSANLGPGFDALGLALSIEADIGVADGSPLPARAKVVDARHPAHLAFRAWGGEGDVWVRSPIPMGRGLGYSGAMRVGGVVAAALQAGGGVPVDELLARAAELEGHADNAAASLLGGFVATAGGHAVRVPLGLAPAVVAWVPDAATSTARSRHSLPARVTFGAASFNVGRTALLVAALATGDARALRAATEDRLHQDDRFVAAPRSHDALACGLDAGAWCGWLSGSGPSVALLCPPEAAATVAAALPAGGHAKILAVAESGARPITPAPDVP